MSNKSFSLVDASYDEFLDHVKDALDCNNDELLERICYNMDVDADDEIEMDDLDENELDSMYQMELRDSINEGVKKLGLSAGEKYLCLSSTEAPIAWQVPIDIGTSILDSSTGDITLTHEGDEPCLRYTLYRDESYGYSPMGDTGAIIPQSWAQKALKSKEFHDTLKNLGRTDKSVHTFLEEAKHLNPAR